MNPSRALLAIGLWIGASSLLVQSDESCRRSETLDECRQRLSEALAADRTRAEAVIVAAESKNRSDLAKNTPGNTPAAPDAASTVNDFISRFRVSADSGGLTGDGEEAIVLELNDFLGLSADGLKLSAVLAQSELFEPLVEAIPEDGRADVVSQLETGLGDFDNVTLGVTYSPFNKRRGRRWELHEDTWSALFSAARDRIRMDTQEFIELEDACDEALGEVLNDLGDEADQLTFAQMQERLPDKSDLIDGLRTSCAAAEVSRMARLGKLSEALDPSGFYLFGDLIHNQPQVYFSVEQVFRDDLVGPNELQATFTFEKGWVNVNSFNAYRKRCTDDALTCLETFLSPKTRRLLGANRVAISVEYTDVDDYDLILADPAIVLDVGGERQLVAQVTYGRYLNVTAEGKGQTRIDIGYSYEDVGDDPVRQDRSMGNVTFTQRVSDTLALSASIVYASDPEFFGQVDDEVSARIGLNYRLLRKEDF